MKAFEQRIISWLWLLNLDQITELVKLDDMIACHLKAFCPGIFRQPRQQDQRYAESGQSWLSFVLSVYVTHICYHVKLACQKAFCPRIFKQQRRQDERYVESRQNWRSFVSSFAPPPSLPWQWSKIKKLPFDNNQKSNLTQIKNPSLKLYSKFHLCSLYPRFCRPRSS